MIYYVEDDESIRDLLLYALRQSGFEAVGFSDGAAFCEAIDAGRLEEAAQEQAYLHARWEHDADWLNFLIGHHHTRAVTSAMLQLSTALEQRWRDESLRALDGVMDALSEVESSDFATLENIL